MLHSQSQFGLRNCIAQFWPLLLTIEEGLSLVIDQLLVLANPNGITARNSRGFSLFFFNPPGRLSKRRFLINWFDITIPVDAREGIPVCWQPHLFFD